MPVCKYESVLYGSVVDCQVLQIYNEKIYDLMQDRRRECPLQLRECGTADASSSGAAVYVRGLSVYRVYSAEEALTLLRKGLRNRAVRSTEFNSDSSRSHSILQIALSLEEMDSSGLMVRTYTPTPTPTV